MISKSSISLLLAIATSSLAYSESATLRLDRDTGVYGKGETITLTSILEAENAPLPMTLTTYKNNDIELGKKSTPDQSGATLGYEFQFEEAGSYMWELSYGDAVDKIGIVVAPEELEPGSKRPADLDAFWDSKKRMLRGMPLNLNVQEIELDESDRGYVAYDIEVDSPGPRPLRGIFAKPANAKHGSLPIIIQYRAAGVKGEWCRANTREAVEFAKRGGGALALDTNAHGMLNHEDEAYYEDLESGVLKDYWNQGIENRDEFYFLNMYLRMLRSIEFLTRQPEWDGKRILVVGESQGGGQALAAAGLDPRVSAAVVTVPAMCDFAAPLVNRKGGWPQPIDWHPKNEAVLETVPYFDAALLLAGSKAKIVAEIGLTDDTCPATGIYAALNQVEGDVTLLPVTYRSHAGPGGDDLAIWETTVKASKDAFIDNYLR